MSSLLPDDYMASVCYDHTALEQIPEHGFDESAMEYAEQQPDHMQEEWYVSRLLGVELAATEMKPISHSDTWSSHSFEEPAPTFMLAQSAPAYYHTALASSSLPSSGFAIPQQRPYPAANQSSGQYAHAFRAAMEATPASEVGSEYSYGSGYPLPSEYLDDGYRARPRNTSAPPLPTMASSAASSQQHMMYGWAQPSSHLAQHSHHPLSHSYGGYEASMSSSYQETSGTGFPMTQERRPSSARLGRRRPSGVPALSFSGLHNSQSAYSPASVTLTPQSGRSMSSMSDYDSQFSPGSTPRSTNSTPRSATSTPRSSLNDKKRSRTGVPHPLERERRVRPKVVAEKGALQCKGVNRKKNTRCRNAALMEYIGPRPLYCAEHITMDPESFYSKCASTYHKVNGDGKGCREVVLKELQYCHKHYNQTLDVLLDGSELGFLKARAQLDRISALQSQLEAEAVAAKRIDPDLFQRKHKLIPKFMEMKKLLLKRMQEFQPTLGHLMNSSQVEFKYGETADSGKESSSITTSPSGSSDEASCNFEESPLMMQVESQNFPVY